MPDNPTPGPEVQPLRRKRPAFLWTFGVCVASTAALAAAAAFVPLPDMGGLWFLIAMPFVWVLAFLLGGIVWFNGRATGTAGVGIDILLGALAGALVGFSLCSGAMWIGGGL